MEHVIDHASVFTSCGLSAFLIIFSMLSSDKPFRIIVKQCIDNA